MRPTAATLFGLALVATSGRANAGERTALSAIPTLPEARDRVAADETPEVGVRGLHLVERAGYAGGSYVDLVADLKNGYCLVERKGPLRLWREMPAEVVHRELWRLNVTSDDQAVFERTRFDVDLGHKAAWVKSRSTVTLRRVGHADGVPVWSYRESTGDLVLLASGATDGLEAAAEETAGTIPEIGSDCTFGAARVTPKRARAGAIAQLRGAKFVVEASTSKVSRDPEPVVSIRVRRFQ